MKKSKVILAIILTFVLIVTCASVPTFSWFTRPNTQTGEKIVLLTDNAYGGYNGKNVTYSTYSSETGLEDSYTKSCTTPADFSTAYDPEHEIDTRVPAYNRRYFCTTITNNSGTEQNVSLYARQLSMPTGTNGTLALGVNYPTRSYRDYSSLTNLLYSLSQNYDKRVYFQTYGVQGWESGKDIYVNFGYEYGDKSFKMNYIRYDSTYGHIYYADLPYSANTLWFSVSGWEKANNGSQDWTMRSVSTTISSASSTIGTSVLCRIKSDKDVGTQNRMFDRVEQSFGGGAAIKQYYHDITVKTGATFDASTDLQYQSGATVKYYTSNDSVFTVNENTGVITGVGAGSAVLYTKVIGSTFGDYIQKETSITVTADDSYVFNDVPIVKNIFLDTDDNSTPEVNEGEIKIYWYILNNSGSNKLSYTINDVYMGL